LFERWIASDLEDRDQARRARLLNVLILLSLGGFAAFLLVETGAWLWGFFGLHISLSAGAAVMIGLLVLSYVFNRRGWFQLAVVTWMGSLSVTVLAALLATGHQSAALALVPSLIIASTVLVRRGTALTIAAGWAVIYLVVALAEVNGLLMPFLAASGQAYPPGFRIVGQLLGIGLIGVLSRLTAGSLLDVLAEARRTLAHLQRREDELQRARASLSQQVRERTRDLENALVDIQESMVEQQHLLRALHEQAIPVVPLFRQVIALPIVGTLDAERTELLLTSLLDGIQRYDAHVALLDITGVPVMDEAAAQSVVEVIAGARMVGAECVLVGINPEIASRLVDLELDLGGLVSRVDMEAGLRYAMQRVRFDLSRARST
jgi:anti-anti-sigma regulatory factor